MTTAISSKLDAYREIWVPDTEYQISPNGLHVPVCICAEELRSGHRIELFFDRERENPFPVGDDILFIGYNAAAEWGTFLSLDWELPTCDIVDLWFEYLNLINGVWMDGHSLRDIGSGLVDAIIAHGLDALTHEEKDEERDYIISNGVVPPSGVEPNAHKRRIFNYCWSDVVGTKNLFLAMADDLNFEQCVFRGRYSVPVAWFQHNGLPTDHATYKLIEEHRAELQLEIAERLEATHQYGVYAITGKGVKRKPVFRADRFDALQRPHDHGGRDRPSRPSLRHSRTQYR